MIDMLDSRYKGQSSDKILRLSRIDRHDEFGIVLPLVMFAFAIYFWMRRKELSLPKSEIGTNQGADIQAQVL